MWRAVFWDPRVSLGCLLLLTAPQAASGAERAVAVGISIYRQDPALGVPRFSPNDAAVISQWFPKLGPKRVVQIVNTSASLDRMLLELRQALLGGEPGGTVYAFLSVRGIALPGWKDGYIGTLDMNENKPESTTLSVSGLARLLDNSTAGNVYLFADLCRDPKMDNRINERVRDYLSDVKKVPVHVILASSGGKASIESERLTMEPLKTSGLGIFAHSLALGLKNGAGGSAGSSAILQFLEKEVLSESEGAQRPLIFTSKARTTAVQPALRYPNFAMAFLPPQRAQPAAGSASQSEDVQPEDLAELPGVLQLIAERRYDAAIAHLLALMSGLQPAAWQILRDRAMVAAADLGQQVVAAYGISDLLPDDPARQTETDFLNAARAFQAALDILSIRPLNEAEHRVFDEYRNFLDSRRLFCEGRAAAFHADRLTAARDLLVSAAARMKDPIPEISNALGITYLEFPSTGASERVRDLQISVHHFEEAIRRSPSWPYPRHNLALAYIQLGDASAAERVYLGAAAVRPRLPYIQYNLGLVQHRANKLNEAARSYDAALTLARAMENDLEKRAVEWKTEMPAEAKLAEARRIAFRHNEAEILNATGALQESRKKWDDAATSYSDAIGINERLCPARQNLARLSSLHGERFRKVTPPDPNQLYETNTRLCPDFTPSWVSFAESALASGKTEVARNTYHELLKLDAQNAEALTGMGRVEEKGNRFAEAAAYYEKAVDAFEKRPGGAGNLAPASAYLALARVKDATTHRAPCELYKRAAQAHRTIGGDRNETRTIRSKLAGCKGR